MNYPAEPLRISTSPGSKILRIVTRSATNDALSFIAKQDPLRPNVACCDFDFLAPGEGVRLQIYETGVIHGVTLTGKVRGQKGDILNWGRGPMGDASAPASWMVRYSTLICILYVLLVVFGVPAGLLVKNARHGHEPDFQLVTFGEGMQIASFAFLCVYQVRMTVAQYYARVGRYPRSLADH